MTLPVSEETVVPATDEQIAKILKEMDTGWPSLGDEETLSLIARIRSERERTIREFADILRKDFLQREDAFWAAYIVEDVALSLSQVSARK